MKPSTFYFILATLYLILTPNWISAVLAFLVAIILIQQKLN